MYNITILYYCKESVHMKMFALQSKIPIQIKTFKSFLTLHLTKKLPIDSKKFHFPILWKKL